ncbi:hypothetical protein BG011_009421 [Mortierella polycephala]|uniref:Uncharacterized protein n=1 Tax=Mortierella polycephala TaxID=41804 RepID=A0A9P6Q8K8_9FUNG|nr:hypothetical protein BG011_009421 [Mortierella polycephala]
MAACYSSSATAPLHALASQFLGESSVSNKTSLFRSQSQQQPQQPQHQPHQHQHHRSIHPQGLFPRQHLVSQPYPSQKHAHIGSDPFDQAWSAAMPPNATDAATVAPHLRHLPDLDMIASWEHAVHYQQQQQQRQATVSSLSMPPNSDLSISEFETFHYQPATLSVPGIQEKGSAWAQEMARQEATEEDEEEDEFREEWSNDHFTRAYIDSHQQQFQQIEEQGQLKETRLQEEREKQRSASCGPPRSIGGWMMAGTGSSGAMTAQETTSTTRRLRVPGLDPIQNAERSSQDPHYFKVNEFMSFEYQDDLQSNKTHPQQPKPVYAEDRFMSLVSDLHLAEQIYYPGASSATTAQLSDEPDVPTAESTTTATAAAAAAEAASGAWAQEFALDASHHSRQRHLGAEWNWEKLFGKDPRRTLQLLSEASSKATLAGTSTSAADGSMTEHERLKSVALARLQALFGHLSLSPIQMSEKASGSTV